MLYPTIVADPPWKFKDSLLGAKREADDMKISDIIAKLTVNGEKFAHWTWVGKNYSKADLLKDLRKADEANVVEKVEKAFFQQFKDLAKKLCPPKGPVMPQWRA